MNLEEENQGEIKRKAGERAGGYLCAEVCKTTTNTLQVFNEMDFII